MSVNGRSWLSLSRALCLGVFLGSVALSGCLADDGESDPEALELEELDEVDSALEEGDGPVRSLGNGDLAIDASDAVEEDGSLPPPGEEQEEPEPHPWFVPADPTIDDSDPAGTPI